MRANNNSIFGLLLLIFLPAALSFAQTVSFGAATSLSVGSTPFAVVVGDFNGDGELDLAVANYASNNVSILVGVGDGTFGSATNFAAGSSPRSVAVGDFNGDGKLDLAVPNATGNVSILIGVGNGAFGAATNFTVGSDPSSVVIGDFNGDGKLDLATANFLSHTVSILLGVGNGTFGAATNFVVGSAPVSVAVGDFNGGGKLDLAVANAGGTSISILLGVGDGTFGAATNFAPVTNPASVGVADLNGDGKLDLAAASFSGNNVSILVGVGDGTFGAATNFAVETHPRSAAVGDFNGDGKLDLAVSNQSSNTVSILLNSQSQVATTIASTSGNNQSQQINAALVNPFVVTVTDAGGNPVQGTSVTFAIASYPAGATGQSLSVTSTTTIANGQASSTLTVGNKVGTYTVTATSTELSGSPLTFTATATAGVATTISVTSGNNQSRQINTALVSPFVVTVTDVGGNPVQAVSVAFAVATTPIGATGQSITAPSASTNANGQASSTLTVGNKVGTYTVTATSTGLSGSPLTLTATATAGTAASLVPTSGNNQQAPIFSQLSPFVVTVADAGGNPVSGVSVVFSISSVPVNSIGASLSVNSAVTNSSGQAFSTLFLGSKIGTNSVTASAQGLSGSPIAFTATATTGPASQVVKISGDNQNGPVNSTQSSPLIVQVTDAGGNPVSGMTVSFSIFSVPLNATGQRLSPASANSDFQGQVSTLLTLGNLAGQYRVSATSLGGVFVTWTANATALSAVEHLEGIPVDFGLSPAYPNPFNPSTRIRFSLPEESRVKLLVYNVLGVQVDELLDETLSAGMYNVVWNADRFPSGSYIVRFQALSTNSLKQFSTTTRGMLLK